LLGLDNVGNVFRITSEKSDQDFSIQTGGFNDRLRIKPTGQIGIGMLSWQDFKVSINADNVVHPIVLYNNKNQLSFIDFWNASTGVNAGVSNRFVTNKLNTTTDWNIASINKFRNGLWTFINQDSNGKIEFDLQGIAGNTTPELVIENDGGVRIPNAAIKFGGTPIAGSIRWTGTDFEGYTGSQWRSLLNNSGPLQTIWTTVNAGTNCSCPSGYTLSADANGNVCQTDTGGFGRMVYEATISWTNGIDWKYVCTNSYSARQSSYTNMNNKCHCVRTN
jgi:hypothetical protein